MEEIIKEVELLVTYGNLGYYKFCEIIQRVLIDKFHCIIRKEHMCIKKVIGDLVDIVINNEIPNSKDNEGKHFYGNMLYVMSKNINYVGKIINREGAII
jgi:hypothetical protein